MHEDDYEPPDPPENLTESGRRLWDSVVKDYALNGGELAILKSACLQEDLADYLHTDWVALGMPTVTSGSRGQDVAHPYVSEIRQHRATTARLIGSLKLEPMDDEDDVTRPGKMTRSEAGKKAAQTRWGRVNGSAGYS